MGLGFMGALDGGRGSVVRVIARANKAAPAFTQALARTVFGLLRFRVRVKDTKSNAVRCVGDTGDSTDDDDVVVDEDGDSIFYNSTYNMYVFYLFFML
jgi:hypothetical protein